MGMRTSVAMHESRQLSRMVELLRHRPIIVRQGIVQDDPTEDYPLGGSLEPYDIETEKELLAN